MKKGHTQRKEEEVIKLVGDNVRRIRISKNLTITELANMAEIEHAHLSRIELGKINTTISMAWHLAKILGVKVTKLFE